MKCRVAPPPAQPEMKITSMIDVIFLLLIFFVCTASFQRLEEKLSLNLSAAGTVEEFLNEQPSIEDLKFLQIQISNSQIADSPITHTQVVNSQLPNSPIVHSAGLIWTIENREYHSLQEVATFLVPIAESRPEIPVILDPEKLIPIEHVLDLFDLCRKLGFTQIQFAAEP
ncbi:MAG: ExbD/TolR family protein [Thermoguttaceae bacterium]